MRMIVRPSATRRQSAVPQQLATAAILIAAASLASAACAGRIGSGLVDEPTEGGGASGMAGAPAGAAGAGSAAGGAKEMASCSAGQVAAPLRRLTPFEYDNTVRELLGTTMHLGASFTRDGLAYGADDIAAYQHVTRGMAQEYQAAAESLAAASVANIDGLVPCMAYAHDSACAAAFVGAFGLRAFRRPLSDYERERLMKVYAAGAKDATFADGIRLVIEAVLQSSAFLYRAPPSVGMNATEAASWDAASKLSYLLWSSMPDEALFVSARQGTLLDATELTAQADRMLKDGRARASVAHVHAQWLGLDALGGIEKDMKAVPAYKPEWRAAWQTEIETFLDAVTWDGDGTMATLLSAPFTYGDAGIATFYGVPAPMGRRIAKLALDPNQRAGLLTQPGVLALLAKPNQTSPVLRGAFVRQQILCEELAPPPPNLDIKPPDLDPALTTRERFAAHAVDPFCAGCHKLMDPIGLGFEHYDAVGAWRASENGKAVDSAGELVGTDVPGRFDGAVELAQRLARSAEVRSCTVRRWFRVAFGRQESDADTCTLAQLEQSFTATARLSDLLAALPHVPPFAASVAAEGGSR